MAEFPLHLLRHGETETPGLFMGRTDGAPTPAGIAACVEQAKYLGCAAIVSSDLARAALAARAIGEAAGLPVATDPRWRELDFGDWDGLAASGVDPQALARFWDDPDRHPPPGGERWSSLVARISAALAALAPAPTLVVTHGGAMRAALAVLCGFEQRMTWAFDLPCGTLLSLRLWRGEGPGERLAARIEGLRA